MYTLSNQHLLNLAEYFRNTDQQDAVEQLQDALQQAGFDFFMRAAA
jgi:hypothetical protein